jgi:putative transcriptional regulator
MNESILDMVHETAKSLRESGHLAATTMKEFDALCLPPVQEYTAEQIQTIRQKAKVSQAVFAAYLNVSKSTVQKWEQGDKKPNGPSLKLLNLVSDKGLTVLS